MVLEGILYPTVAHDTSLPPFAVAKFVMSQSSSLVGFAWPAPWIAQDSVKQKDPAPSVPSWGKHHLKLSTISEQHISQARKGHINMNSLVWLLLGRPGSVPGTNRVCPLDKPTLSQGQSQVFSLFYTMEAQFVPGTIPEKKGGRKSLCVKSYVPFVLANTSCLPEFEGFQVH